jgi:AcrR family transcriptional regulator
MHRLHRHQGESIAELLTMSGLIQRTGVPRTSIHFYLREGLLPQPHKTAVNRSLYTEDHVELLQRIQEFKTDGLSLAEIRTALKPDVARIDDDDTDLIALENARIRKTILRVATKEFMDQGYENARVADIIRKAGVTSQVFYVHFPSKAELLIESFKTFMSWNLAFVEPQLQTADQGERLLWRMLADAGANDLGSSVMSVIRTEVPTGAELNRLVEQAWAPIVSRIVLDLEGSLRQGATTAASLELLAYSLVGAMHNSSQRVSWDDTFTREDVLTTHLWLYLAVVAGLSGQVDIDSRVARYEDLIKEVAARKPESPPAPDE